MIDAGRRGRSSAKKNILLRLAAMYGVSAILGMGTYYGYRFYCESNNGGFLKGRTPRSLSQKKKTRIFAEISPSTDMRSTVRNCKANCRPYLISRRAARMCSAVYLTGMNAR